MAKIRYNLDYWEILLKQNSKTAQEICELRWSFVACVAPLIILDYGCGPGWFRAFRPTGVEVDTYDIAPWPQTGILHDHYDLITFWDVFEHIRDLDSLIPLFGKARNIAMTIPILPKGKKLKEWKHYKPGEHFHYFSKDSIVSVMDQYGFKKVKEGWPEVDCGIRENIYSILFQAKKKTVVFTNGVFDLIHPGHLYILEKAKALGDKLIVGLDSDRNVQRLDKKPKRPVNNQEIRKKVVEALQWVDEVRVFDDHNELKTMLREIQPDFMVKGGDYRKEQIVGAKIVEDLGGQIVIIPYLEGKSTTSLINQIRGL
ncbi:adenylyltransferase/cytidyltransferase family protein [candidate division WOR-3 bacterium]|nr:adenylyltransferase/cytidyltransferase family protein [candidate division WOR-3 bacterium]